MNLYLSQQCLILSNSSTEALDCHCSSAKLNFLYRESLHFVLKMQVHGSNKLKVEGQPGRGEPYQCKISVTRSCRNSRGLQTSWRLKWKWYDQHEMKEHRGVGGNKISTLKTKSKIICFNFQSPSEQKTKRVFTELPSEVTAGKQCIS